MPHKRHSVREKFTHSLGITHLTTGVCLRVRQLGAILEGVDAVLEIVDKIVIKLSVVQDMLNLVRQYHYS
jgi:hypothetical protein